MTNTNATAAAKPLALRYLACLRPQDVLVLQGPPLLGAVFAMGTHTMRQLAPLATLMGANLFLVAHIFLLNDWSGLAADLADPNKARRVFTARGVGRAEIGILAAGVLSLSLFLFSRLRPMTFVLALATVALSALYSVPRFHWKGRPLLNSFAHLAGGILHFLLGYSIGRPIDHRGFFIATFFALVFAAGHLAQEIRDHDGDAANGITTNAVRFGPQPAFIASLALFTLAQMILLALAVDRVLPLPLAFAAALYPLQLHWSFAAWRDGLTYASVSRLQSRYRALYALVGVAMVATVMAPIV